MKGETILKGLLQDEGQLLEIEVKRLKEWDKELAGAHPV